MPYTKQTWVDGPGGNTPMSSTRLNYIENGIATAQSTAESAAGTTVGPAGTVPVSNGTTAPYTQLTSAYVGITVFEMTGGGNYTFQLADVGKLKGSLTGDTGPITWTYPTYATVAIPIGATIKVMQRGPGQITIAGTGVTFLYAGSGPKTSQQNGTLLLTKLFNDTVLVEGGVA